MENVRLEIAAAVAVQPLQVMQFIQELRGVPRDALCEIQDVYCKQSKLERLVQTDVQLSCEPIVAEFLSHKFGMPCKHVVGGEIMQIRCRRVHKVKPSPPRPSTLPMETVVALIEFLGDQVVEARDAYEEFADEAAPVLQRMSMIGLTKALKQLCSNEWTAKQSLAMDASISVSNLRRLLSRMIATGNIAISELPASTTAPFLSYTDFLACYVAFLNLMHAVLSIKTTERKYNDALRPNTRTHQQRATYEIDSCRHELAMFAAGAGMEPQVSRGEMRAATPNTKKKSRRKRDADLCSELSVPSEMVDRGFQRGEADEAASSARSGLDPSHRARVAGTTASRPEYPVSSDPAQLQGAAAVPRTRSVSRTTGSASSTSSTSNSVHRRLSSLSKRDQAVYNPETSNPVALARQSLTSSASALRPSKQKLERNHLLSRAHVECREQLDRYSSNNNDNNNNEDSDEGDAPSNIYNDHEAASNRSESYSEAILGADDWMYEKNLTRTEHRIPPTAALPSRARRYWNVVPQSGFSSLEDHPTGGGGDDRGGEGEPRSTRRELKSARAASSNASSILLDRPPSRQRHAFPTHLIDTNGFVAQPAANGSSNTRAIREKSVHSAAASIPISDAVTTERPPSRYMTKVKRSAGGQVNAVAFPGGLSGSVSPDAQGSPGSASGSPDSTRLPSRRCIDSVYSLNQVNHDPKTDGFADVDESVPPPFRIEITTDSYHNPAQHHKSPTDVSPTMHSLNHRQTSCSSRNRSNLQSIRWSSFGNQEQLHQHTMSVQNRDDRVNNNGGGGDRDSMGRKNNRPLERFGQDDQINNAHLFETIVSSPSPHFERDFDTLDDRLSSSSSSPASPPPEPLRSTTRGPPIMAVLHSTQPSNKQQQGKQISDEQWILASNNPFFFNVPAHSASDFLDMDPETAIAQTPLYSSEDLMTIATEMSDLHLDDFIMGELQPMPLSIALGAGSGGGSVPTTSPALNTSLGKDFLSLFAQH